ncbi:MAG: SAM-dependent methyltransferase [Nocardioides sp.]
MTVGDSDGLDPIEHPMVMAAMARLGGNGGWARLREGGELTNPMDLADAELLVAVGLLAAEGDHLRVARDDPRLHDPETMSYGILARLQRAFQHASGTAAGWGDQDPTLMLNQGRASAVAVELLAERLIPRMQSVREAFAEHGRFLDVGVGVGAISIELCRRFPRVAVLGIDVLEPALELAMSEILAARLDNRIMLRHLSVADLAAEDVFDLAWLPQPFIPWNALVDGTGAVFRALKPDGWLVMPLATASDDVTGMEAAVMTHAAHVLGGGPVTVPLAVDLLTTVGFVDIDEHAYGGQVVLAARKP